MPTTFDVRIWSTEVYQGKRAPAYIVRWKVGIRRFKERYKTRALADSFRSELMTAARKGEAFDVDTGLPASVGVESSRVVYDRPGEGRGVGE